MAQILGTLVSRFLQFCIINGGRCSMEPAESNTPTDVFTVRTSGQGKFAGFWFQLGAFQVQNQFVFD